MKEEKALSTTEEFSENAAVEEKSTFTTKVNVGDFVRYTGDCDEETNDWRVWQKNDDHVIITPITNCYSRPLVLYGIVDFLDIVKNAKNQTDRINKACKRWYSNEELGVSAEDIRSMTVEDINEISGYKPPYKNQYVYHPAEIKFESHVYYYCPNEVERYTYYPNKVEREVFKLDDEVPILGNGYTEPRFYYCDKGGAERTDSNGNTYWVVERDKPVYVTNTERENSYSLTKYVHKDNPTITLSDILANSDISGGFYSCWLASACVRAEDYSVGFGVHTVGGHKYIESAMLFGMRGVISEPISHFVRPLVSLSSKLQIVGGDGSKNAPWELSR